MTLSYVIVMDTTNIEVYIIMLLIYYIAGPCITARARDVNVDCDDVGNFEPLQCRRMPDGSHTCYCAFPRNGSMVPNTMRSGIRDRNNTPDCESRGTQ